MNIKITRPGYIYGCYKLLDGQVNEIVRRYNEGERAADLAEEFGVTTKTVLKYIRNGGRPRKDRTVYNGKRHIAPVDWANTWFSNRRDIHWDNKDIRGMGD